MGFSCAHFIVECARQRGRIEADLLQCRREWRRRIAERSEHNVLNAHMRMLKALRLGESATINHRAFGLQLREQFFLLTFVDHHKVLVQSLLIEVIRDSRIGSCGQNNFQKYSLANVLFMDPPDCAKIVA